MVFLNCFTRNAKFIIDRDRVVVNFKRRFFYKKMIFDTHTHYDDDAFANDLDEVLQKARENGVGRITNIASDLPSIDKCLELAEKYEQIYCAHGVHPTECGEMTDEDLSAIREKLAHRKAVAVGEIGLDYYWDTPDRDIQRHWFKKQLQLAMEVQKPIVVHSREAAEETFRILEENYDGDGVIHCYSYSAEMAKEYVKRGYFLGVGGVVTYKNARKLVETVEAVPLTSIVLETDCPYLSPDPYRGKRNSSANLPLVVKKIAALKDVSEETVIRQTEENAERLYHL